MKSDRVASDKPRPEQPARVRFRLLGSLTEYGSAEAQRIRWNGTSFVDYGEPITVHDSTGWHAEVTDPDDPEEIVRGKAEYWPDAQRWEVYDLVCTE
jgi:ribosomal protein S12 methylthiotransferase accessory factor YcaO